MSALPARTSTWQRFLCATSRRSACCALVSPANEEIIAMMIKGTPGMRIALSVFMTDPINRFFFAKQLTTLANRLTGA
jgi:hypothetical protein